MMNGMERMDDVTGRRMNRLMKNGFNGGREDLMD